MTLRATFLLKVLTRRGYVNRKARLFIVSGRTSWGCYGSTNVSEPWKKTTSLKNNSGNTTVHTNYVKIKRKEANSIQIHAQV